MLQIDVEICHPKLLLKIYKNFEDTHRDTHVKKNSSAYKYGILADKPLFYWIKFVKFIKYDFKIYDQRHYLLRYKCYMYIMCKRWLPKISQIRIWARFQFFMHLEKRVKFSVETLRRFEVILLIGEFFFWLWIVFVERLTNKKNFPLFSVAAIIIDSHHHKSPKRHEHRT